MGNSSLVQVTRLDSVTGVLLYGWKRPLTKDPLQEPNLFFADCGNPSDLLPPPEPIGVGDPSNGLGGLGVEDVPEGTEIIWLPEGWPVPTGFEPYLMAKSFRGTRFGLGKGRWGVCRTCLQEFPLEEMSLIRGQWYCHKNGCAEEQS